MYFDYLGVRIHIETIRYPAFNIQTFLRLAKKYLDNLSINLTFPSDGDNSVVTTTSFRPNRKQKVNGLLWRKV